MLSAETGWNGNMIRGLVVRLLDKGAIGAETKDRYFRYYPIASEEECLKQETRSFVDRVFEGSIARLFAAFAGSGKISEEERRELEAMLKDNPGIAPWRLDVRESNYAARKLYEAIG